ncbi:MAG TPA: methyltransferase domain-containing protein [Ktedonobacteraceae bacterium]
MSSDVQRQKAEITSLYSRVASTYGRVGPDVFSPIGSWLVELMHLPTGSDVLDVATGRGAILFPAAEQVGPDGQVIGIDLAEQMVLETARDIEQRGVKNARVQLMDAEQLTFPDASFDAVLCGYALFFFPDIEQALSEFYRVLRPGGRLGVSVPCGGDERWRWYAELLHTYSERYHFSTARGGPFLGADTVKEMFSHAGFVAIQDGSKQFDFVWTDEQEWWSSKWTEAARFPLERMQPAVLEQFKRDVFKKTEQLKQADGLHELRIACSFLGTKSLV